MSTTTSPGTFARALTERRRARARRKLIGAVVGAVILVVGAVAVYLFWFSDVLAVTEVSVEGNQLVSTDRVIETAAVPMGEPLLTTDIRAIDARVSDLVELAAVVVERQFPGTVAITVTERTLAYQRLADGQYHWVDPAGVQFRTLPTAEPGTVIAVTASDDVRLLTDVATIVDHLPEALLQRVAQVDARGVDEIVIQLDDGDQVIWGSAEQSDLKAQVLTVLLDVDATVYDVSAPGHPTTK